MPSWTYFKWPHATGVACVCAVVILLCVCAPQEEIQVTNTWLRPSHDTTAAYMRIKNTTLQDNALIAVETSAADTVEIHTVTGEDEMMRMRPVNEIALPKQETVSLEPGGYHLMLFGLQKPLQEGEYIYFTLFFKNQTTKIVKAEVLTKAPPLSLLSGPALRIEG